MTYGGYGSGPSDPFGGDPFGGSPSGGPGYGGATPGFGSAGPGYPSAPPSYPGGPGYPGIGTPPPPPHVETNTLSTLSIVFAVVFAPVGAVLGHMALHQIRERGQRGRERALIGLTLSYVIIVAAVVALVIWLIGGNESDTTSTVSTTPTTTRTTTRPPPPKTTVITAPPTTRPTVTVAELRVGDCVEVQQNERVPGDPDTSYINIYRTPCQVRDGVARVDQIVSVESQCGGSLVMFNTAKTIFACVSDFKG